MPVKRIVVPTVWKDRRFYITVEGIDYQFEDNDGEWRNHPEHGILWDEYFLEIAQGIFDLLKPEEREKICRKEKP